VLHPAGFYLKDKVDWRINPSSLFEEGFFTLFTFNLSILIGLGGIEHGRNI
jgi:hypothetical protein